MRSQWQARWAEILTVYDLVIEHLKDKKHRAHRPLRRSGYEIRCDIMTATLLATLAGTTISESYGDLLPDIKAAQQTHLLATDVQQTLVDVSTADDSQQ